MVIKNKLVLAVFTAIAISIPSIASAAGGAALRYHFSPDLGNEASLQRGAKLYMNYCAGCHSMKYMRYNRIAEDLNIPINLVEENLMFTGDNVGKPITIAMSEKDGNAWFGQAPPDLTLTSRAKGADWIYSYLMTFYLDPTRPTGTNNETLPGASMPHVLWSLQGWQEAVLEEEVGNDGKPHTVIAGYETTSPGSLDDAEYRKVVSDITNFMVYAGEPIKLKRYSLGIKVILFLILFTILAYAMKREFWKDVH